MASKLTKIKKDNKLSMDIYQDTAEILSDATLGTVLLAIIKLVDEGNPARYKDICGLVFPQDDTNRTAKLKYHIDKLQGLNQNNKLMVAFINSNDVSVKEEFKIVEKNKEGRYVYIKKRVVDFFIYSLYFNNYKYADFELFNTTEIKEAIFSYLLHFVRKEANWQVGDVYSVNDILECLESDLLIGYSNNKLKGKLKEWAILIEKESPFSKNIDPFK